jgi:hypothetical protein
MTTVERRRERRIDAQVSGTTPQTVKVTLLGRGGSPDGGDQKAQPLDALLLDYSGRGMRLEFGFLAAPGTALRIEFDDQVLLGEVCYCQSMGEGRYAAGIELEQSLKNLDDLSRLMRALVDDNPTPIKSGTAA